VVENRRVKGARVVQRHVLYLGEINDAQRAAWCKSLEVLEEDGACRRQMAIFPEDREAPQLSCAVVRPPIRICIDLVGVNVRVLPSVFSSEDRL
jgi:hypothetical protein